VGVKPRSWRIEGNATFTMDASRITMNWQAHASERINQAGPAYRPAP
jgi:hypothetical protein